MLAKVPLVFGIDLNPIDWLSSGAKGLVKTLVSAPFNLLASLLHDWLVSIAGTFEQVFVHQAIAHAGGIQTYLLGESEGLAEFLVSLCFMAVATAFVLMPGYNRRMGRTLKVVAMMAMAPVLFFVGLNLLSDLGMTLTSAATHIYTPPKGHHALLWVNAIANVLESILAFAGVLAGAGALYIIWLAVQGIMMISFLFLLPFFALSVAFEWAEKIANWLFAVFFVGAVLFGFIVVSCLEIGEWAADTLPVGGTLWIIAMLCASIIFVIMAVIACHKVIEHYHGKIHGRVRSWGKSDVKGKVKTEPTDKQGMQERHAAAFRRSVPARRAAVAVSTATGAGAVATVGAAGAAGVAGAAGNMGVPGRSGATGSAGGPGRAARTSAGASPQGRAPGSPSQILKRETTTRPTVKNIRNIQTGSDRSGSPPSRQGGRATRPPDTRRPPGRSSGPPPR